MDQVAFAEQVRRYFTPWTRMSGTEHMAVLLHSLVRSLRPTVVIEDGSGYTTGFLARAVKDNTLDFDEEVRLLIAKSPPLLELGPLPPGPMESWPIEIRKVVRRWLDSGDKSSWVDPAYYLTAHRPRFYCFENLGEHEPYVATLRKALTELDLMGVTELRTGGPFSVDKLPPDLSIDLIWTDFYEYRDLFTKVWPRLNPRGGVMIFHWPWNDVQRHDIEWMKAQRREADDLEVLSIIEPHKLVQSGCAILRKTSDKTIISDTERELTAVRSLEVFLDRHLRGKV